MVATRSHYAKLYYEFGAAAIQRVKLPTDSPPACPATQVSWHAGGASWSPAALDDRSVSSVTVDDALLALAVDPAVGLSSAEANRRRARVGRNLLHGVTRRRAVEILIDQFRSIVILLLLTAGGLAVLFAELIEGLAIFIVIAINSGIGFVTELRAVRSMEALSRLGRVDTAVMRDGLVRQIPAEDLVPGDIVIHDAGDIVTADLRLLEASKLQTDESTLTGESMPVGKSVDVVAAGAPTIGQSNMLFKGTAITRGSCRAVVAATGLNADTGALALLDDLLTVSALCNNASIDRSPEGGMHSVGDPTEVALLVAAEQRNIRRQALLERLPEQKELAFDPDTKRMATLHADNDAVLVAAKGAPEAIIPICTHVHEAEGDLTLSASGRDAWILRAHELGEQGLRTLAIARKTRHGAGNDAYAELTLLGIVGLEDPPRRGVRDAIRKCHDAGISVVMVTGDHAATARHVATEVGIVDADAGPEQFVADMTGQGPIDAYSGERLDTVRVYSRVSPKQKLDLIDAYQRQNRVVAMTGDGVNDAPALKKADIGIAMGIRGTAVAKDAAAMVLRDDDFGTIVEAVTQGRAIFSNIRKFVVYLLSCNISEVLIVSIATIAGLPLPLVPLQILFLNLVTDVFPALALGVGEGSPALIRQRPRPFEEPILTKRHWIRIVLHADTGAGMACFQYAQRLCAVTRQRGHPKRLGMGRGCRLPRISLIPVVVGPFIHALTPR